MSIADALRLLPLSRVYDIHCGKWVFEEGLTIQREIASKSINNPFAPAVNLHFHSDLEGREWYIAAAGEAVGSKGY